MLHREEVRVNQSGGLLLNVVEKLKEDPFLPDASLSKCNAIGSSLWELEALSNHYSPAIANFAQIFKEYSDKPHARPLFDLDKYSATSYKWLFENEMSRTFNKPPALAFEAPPSQFFSTLTGDPFGCWDFSRRYKKRKVELVTSSKEPPSKKQATNDFKKNQ